MLLVSLPTEQIDKDFTQSYWLALQFVPTKKNKPSRIFTVGMPQASHGIIRQVEVPRQLSTCSGSQGFTSAPRREALGISVVTYCFG